MRRGAAAILLVFGLLWAWALVSGYDPVADVNPAAASLGPSLTHLLGTDHLGRDVLSRVALAVGGFAGPGMVAALLSALVGVPLGALIGAADGVISGAARLLMGALASVPGFVLALLMATVWGASPGVLALSIGLAYAPALAEEVGARLQGLYRAEFVLALRAHGHGEARILLWHLLWLNARALTLRHALQVFAFTLATETTLSYLGGYGVAEPQPSWGNMLSLSFGRQDNPLAALAPALCLWAASLALALLAGGVVERRHGR